MTIRFRIRTSAGQELSFASHQMFEDFVRSGDLSPDDLVYDGETGSWAPARTHPLVLEIEYEKEAAAEAAAKGEDTDASTQDEEGEEAASADNAFGLKLAAAQSAADEGDVEESSDAPPAADTTATQAPDGDGDGDSDAAFGLALAPEDALMSPEDAAKAFVQKMEAERESHIDVGSSDKGGLQGFSMEDSNIFGSMPEPEPAAPPPPPPVQRSPSTRPRGEPSGGAASSKPEPPQRSKERKGSFGKMVAGIALVGAVGAGGYFGLQYMGAATVEGDDSFEPDDTVEAMPVPNPTPPPPRPQPVIATSEAAVRERAQERFLTATQSLFRGLQPIPDGWPLGGYLSVPSDHAAVLDVWQDYLATVRRVRAADDDRYETAYESALNDAAIEGDARNARLGVALRAFEASAARRDAHYDRVEALATAAIQSHNALLEAEGLVLFDPTRATGATSGIGRGTYGRDADSQLLLDQVLDLLTATLDADGLGPGEASNVRSWVWDGLLGAVANE